MQLHRQIDKRLFHVFSDPCCRRMNWKQEPSCRMTPTAVEKNHLRTGALKIHSEQKQLSSGRRSRAGLRWPEEAKHLQDRTGSSFWLCTFTRLLSARRTYSKLSLRRWHEVWVLFSSVAAKHKNMTFRKVQMKWQEKELYAWRRQISVWNIHFRGRWGMSLCHIWLQIFVSLLDGFLPSCNIFVIQAWHWRWAGIVPVSIAESFEVRDLIWPLQRLKGKDWLCRDDTKRPNLKVHTSKPPLTSSFKKCIFWLQIKSADAGSFPQFGGSPQHCHLVCNRHKPGWRDSERGAAPHLMVLFYSILECVKDVDDDNGNSFPKNTRTNCFTSIRRNDLNECKRSRNKTWLTAWSCM